MAKAKSFMEVFGQMSAIWRAGDMLSVYQFYRKPFSFNMLANPHGRVVQMPIPDNTAPAGEYAKKLAKWKRWDDAEKNILFHGWHLSGEWKGEITQYSNEANPQNRVQLLHEESKIYVIRSGGKGLKATCFLPRTLDDFINDCHRAQVGLIWNSIIVESFNFK